VCRSHYWVLAGQRNLVCYFSTLIVENPSRALLWLCFFILCTTERERDIGALRGKLSLRLFGGDYSFDGVVSAIAGDGFKISITAYENAAAVSRQKTMDFGCELAGV
jgi:hypothetical protein